MQLAPGERALLAYFATSDEARKAAAELKNAGLETVRVDRVSRFGASEDAHFNNPVNRAVTINGPTLYSDSGENNIGTSEGVLLAADPSASGLGDAGYGVAGGKAFLLTVVTEEDKSEQAESIISRHGGKI